ncbi:hypothetical protein PoB_003956100 [Plakobranchus ocellatus]|uniref:Uncharacterized protein n=1 Tax=Plakobranchus ocellatus TaxID=259542 RepID=A0AAV4AXU1_9GAST|nr:hypothetical protein PoB_003956100 [Plakobranchus ocellatus]
MFDLESSLARGVAGGGGLAGRVQSKATSQTCRYIKISQQSSGGPAINTIIQNLQGLSGNEFKLDTSARAHQGRKACIRKPHYANAIDRKITKTAQAQKCINLQ